MGLDLGERRIGLAVSDAEGKLALPAGHVQRTKLKEDLLKVLEAAQSRGVQGLVVGVPYQPDGTTGQQAKRALGFVKALKRQTPLPVYTVDESFTSVEAEGLMREAGRQPSMDRAAVDEAAAALILRRFLDQRNSGRCTVTSE